MNQEQGVLQKGLDKIQTENVNPVKWVIGFIYKTFVIAELEARKLKHDPTELLTRAAQPALWMLVFGEVFTRLKAIPTGNMSYMNFIAPGILAQSVLFVAIFYGISIIWERDLGIVHKFLASPIPRASIVLGKALSAGIRAVSQAIIIYLLSLLLHVGLSWDPIHLRNIIYYYNKCSALFDLLINNCMYCENA
jgi:ABC-2 type transport system permease protein